MGREEEEELSSLMSVDKPSRPPLSTAKVPAGAYSRFLIWLLGWAGAPTGLLHHTIPHPQGHSLV